MTIFKELGSQDTVSTKTLLHEAIPLTGSIVSGTYGTFPNGGNIKNYSHGMFQSVYDYPYLSSSANHIFDITFGVSTSSNLYSTVTKQKAKKNNIYNQMGQVLVGYDKDGNIQRFDEDGNLTGGKKLDNCVFFTFSRLLVKDEIMKGTFELELGLSASFLSTANQPTNNMNGCAVIKDHGAATSYKVNSPVGEYGILYVSNSSGYHSHKGAVKNNPNFTTNKVSCGLIFYQAGVVALSSSLFMGATVGLLSASVDFTGRGGEVIATRTNLTSSLKTVEISASADGLRKRIKNISFNNTIELNSTIHFCRLNHNEFNYSGNPTYLSGSQIRVKNTTTDIPISYITTIGLYSADNQLLAVGKLSEPIRKDNNIELTFRARLDY